MTEKFGPRVIYETIANAKELTVMRVDNTVEFEIENNEYHWELDWVYLDKEETQNLVEQLTKILEVWDED